MSEAVVFTREADFRAWFEKNLDAFGVKRVILNQEACPDYVLEMNDGRIAKVEAELFAVNFRYHGHDPAKVDFILACFSKSESIDGVPVIAVNRLWVWDSEPSTPLPPGPLTGMELRVLVAVHFQGGVAISALSDPFPGKEQLWLRFAADAVDSFPRGADHGPFSVMAPDTKKFIKKYHHALLAAGLSREACLALESLKRRGLVKYRPLSYLAALMDGGLVHPAWLPTEIFLTEIAETMYESRLRRLLFASPEEIDRAAAEQTAGNEDG